MKIYFGDGENHAQELAEHAPQPLLHEERGKYLADPDLADAVNIALVTGQPLLVTGEPGCGKTRLAWSIASELGLDKPHEFHTRSTSRAQDVLYCYDAVRRFHDIQARTPHEGGLRADHPELYVEPVALGKAIQEGRPCVVLIDEIDKAPRDFPNDLLNELDRMKFAIPELGPKAVYEATQRPIVVITSNSERQLPAPFLRRCVFHHIGFPSSERLRQILDQRLGSDEDRELYGVAVDRFTEIRALAALQKKPATSELLAWTQALRTQKITAQSLKATPLPQLPLWQTLIKSHEDRQVLLAAR